MKRANGEGTIYKTIQKIKRKNKLEKECKTCINCTSRDICNNRTNCKLCPKCQNCKDFSSCDIYYCYEKWVAQSSINGKITTLASGKKQKDATSKKIEKENKIRNGSYVNKNNITLPEILENVEKTKLNAKIIEPTTYARNLSTIKHIKNSDIAEIPIQQLTTQDIQSFLNSKTSKSQSVIDKIIQELNIGFKEAEKEKIITENPMKNILLPFSEKNRKEVIAFEVEEEKILINYITHKKLIVDSKCSYDEETLRNIFLIALITGARIGELGAIDYTKDIDFNKRIIIIDNSLTKDENYKVVLGTRTKTGKKKNRKGQKDKREIPFEIFKKGYIEKILKNQIEVAKSNANNRENLLFCKKTGNYLVPSEINNIFKRICREAKIKLDIPTGCNEHMCRHTATTRMIEADINPMLIAEILGHSSTRELERTYGHILKRFRNTELKNLDKYYKKINI